MKPLLPLVTLVSAALSILAAPWALALPWLAFVFKPLTTVLVIVFASGRGRAQPVQRRWVLVGLVLSLAGDVALLWPQQGFLPGLVCFLLAHGAYLGAFTRDRPLASRPLPFVAYALVAGGILWLLWPGIPAGLRAPVLMYGHLFLSLLLETKDLVAVAARLMKLYSCLHKAYASHNKAVLLTDGGIGTKEDQTIEE